MKINNEEQLQSDDVLLIPQYSTIKSRKDVDTSSDIGGLKLSSPILSAPMDTVTTVEMAKALHKDGSLAILHRFQLIGDNLKQFKDSPDAIVSVGLNDWERIDALATGGAEKFLLDVAHGAQQSVVEFVKQFRAKYKNEWLMIGNFATHKQIYDVNLELTSKHAVNAWRVGVGGGAACTTRIKTGHGLPTFSSVVSCVKSGLPIVADGGCRNPGDYAKFLAAGAKAVIMGRALAGTDETPSYPNLVETPDDSVYAGKITNIKMYRGSASAESYSIQNKDWACAEGEAYEIPAKGPVAKVLAEFDAGLRSAMTYTGAKNLQEFTDKAIFTMITSNGSAESKAHGR